MSIPKENEIEGTVGRPTKVNRHIRNSFDFKIGKKLPAKKKCGC